MRNAGSRCPSRFATRSSSPADWSCTWPPGRTDRWWSTRRRPFSGWVSSWDRVHRTPRTSGRSVGCFIHRPSAWSRIGRGGFGFPSDLVALSVKGREIVLIGVRDHLEVWDRERWQGYLGQKQPFYDEIAESAFGCPPRAAAPTLPEEPLATVRPR